MGSTGTGRFGDYPGKNGMGSVKGGGNTQSCPTIIETIRLEDVQQLDYYSNHQQVPPIGHLVEISNKLYHGRVVVVSSVTHEIIGNMPTQYNYLYPNCIMAGVIYSGKVVSSDELPIPYVVVTLNAR